MFDMLLWLSLIHISRCLLEQDRYLVPPKGKELHQIPVLFQEAPGLSTGRVPDKNTVAQSLDIREAMTGIEDPATFHGKACNLSLIHILITEDGTNDIYMIGLWSPSEGVTFADYAYLYQLNTETWTIGEALQQIHMVSVGGCLLYTSGSL